MFRDIKTTTVTQMRDVHIRDKIIKDCILLGSSLTVGMFSSRIVSCLHQKDAVPFWSLIGHSRGGGGAKGDNFLPCIIYFIAGGRRLMFIGSSATGTGRD